MQRKKPHFTPMRGGWLCTLPTGHEEWGQRPREAWVAAMMARLRAEAKDHRRNLRRSGWMRGEKRPPGPPQWSKTQ